MPIQKVWPFFLLFYTLKEKKGGGRERERNFQCKQNKKQFYL